MKVGDLVLYKKEYAGKADCPGVVIEMPLRHTYVAIAFHNNIATCHKDTLEVVNEDR